MANKTIVNGYKQCPRCLRVLSHNNHNFGPRPGKPKTLDRICKLCRSEVSSNTQRETNDYIHNEKMKLVKKSKSR